MREVGWAGQGWGAGVALVNVGLAGDRNGSKLFSDVPLPRPF